MKIEQITAYTERCFNSDPASCSYACPFRLDIRAFLDKTQKGKWNAAYKSFRTAAAFPVIVSELCPAPCKAHCQRTQTGDEAIDLPKIEQAVLRYAKIRKPESYVIPPKSEKIAVVGAGTAGLSAALGLAQKKYSVTVFDKNSGWGGSLRSHPRFDGFSDDIALQFSAAPAQFEFDTLISDLSELADFDLIYVATGENGEDFGLLPGWDDKFLTTSIPNVFLGGSLTNMSKMDGIARGIGLSKTAEVFLQTGKTFDTPGGEGENHCNRYLDHTGAPPEPLIIPADEAAGYTEDETRAESARCFKCDCDKCLKECEMLNSFRKKPRKIAVEVFTDTQVNPPFSTHTITRQAYSCNMCGHCKQVCGEDIYIGELLQKSRESRVDNGVYPQAIHDYWLREMDFSTGEGAFFAPPPGRDSCEYVFFPGCQLGAHNPEHVYRSMNFLSRNYNAGVFISCCGAPAYWAGDSARHEHNNERIRSAWDSLGKPVFVFACATCQSMFETFLPEISRISLYELLSSSQELSPIRVFSDASVFDPCNARKNPAIESAVRQLAEKSGTRLAELPENNRCCGYGGHMRLGNPELYDKITEKRAALGELPYIVYCANCREVFLSRGKECSHILDMAFGLDSTVSCAKIDEKRQNSLSVKRMLMKEFTDEQFAPSPREWDDVELIVSDTLRDDMERRLISLADIKEAIWYAESTGDKFIDSGGVCRCSMERPVLTYWAAYKKTDSGAFELFEAYCHRMRFSKES